MSPLDSTQTNTAMSAQPTRNVKGGHRVQINLIYDGVVFDPALLITALRAQYGATKVSSDKDSTAQDVYHFRIIA